MLNQLKRPSQFYFYCFFFLFFYFILVIQELYIRVAFLQHYIPQIRLVIKLLGFRDSKVVRIQGLCIHFRTCSNNRIFTA